MIKWTGFDNENFVLLNKKKLGRVTNRNIVYQFVPVETQLGSCSDNYEHLAQTVVAFDTICKSNCNHYQG